MTAQALWSPRARLLLLIYAAGWLALMEAALQLYVPLPGIVALAGYIVQAVALLVCLGAAVALAFGREKPAAREPEPGVEALVAEWRRVGRYARDSVAHVAAVPLLLMTVGLLLLIVMRDMPRTFDNDLLKIVMGLGYIALSTAGFVPLVGVIREAKRIGRLEAQLREAPEL